MHTREVAVERTLDDDPPSEAWRDHALKHDYRACAVVPLVYEETLYGILHLASNRPKGFDAIERESLAELGVTIACARENAKSPEDTDSTEHKEAEAELTRVIAEPEQERRLYETIISSTPDLIYAFDLDYRIIFANEALLEMWGQSYEGSIGKTLQEIGYEPWYAEMHEREIDQVVETKEPIRGEVAFEHAELGHRVYDYIFAPVLNDEGDVEAIAGTTRDITERKEAEETLQESEERFRALVNASSDVVYRMGPDWSEMYHLEGQEFIPDTEKPTSDWLEKYIHPDDQEHVVEAINEAIETKSLFELEHRVKEEDGSLGWTLSRAVPRLDEDGDIVEWVGMARDITDRKEREQALEESEARFRILAENLEEMVWISEADTREILYINPAYEVIWGRDRGSVYDDATSFLDDVHPDDRQRAEQAYEALPEEEFNEEYRIVRPDGQIRWLDVHAAPARAEENNRVVGFAEDVTERRERERALKESERRYRTLVENFPNGSVGLFNEDLEYTVVGGELFDSLDFDPEDRIGERFTELHPPEIVEKVEPYFEAALNGEANTFEIEYADRHLQANTLPVRDASDDVFAGMLVIQDVTERLEYQRQLEESNERLEQFAYAVSHDLQEPLRMVTSYLQLIGERYGDELDADGQEFIDFAVNGADRMREMIDALLDYSRVETEGQPFEPVDLEAVFGAVLDDLQFRIEESKAEISRDSLPAVHGDKDQLREVFQNLLDNAIEYSSDAPPEVHVGAERDGDCWTITVEDNGIGIDQEDQDRVFEVFERLHSCEEHAGTGIGLALCKRIVERHGGEIWVESEPGEGTTFSFTLPATDT